MRRPTPLLACVALAALGAGLAGATLERALPEGLTSDAEQAIRSLRMHRAVVAWTTGAALATGGVLVQAVFRNALASPSILGVTAGASLGGTLALWASALGAASVLPPATWVPVGCFAGALSALALLLALTRGATQSTTFLLGGFLLSSLFMSAGAFLLSLSQSRWEVGRAIVSFSLGSVAGSGPLQIVTVGAMTLAGATAAWGWRRSLDVMMTGDEEARSLGVDVVAVRRWGVVWTALLSAGAVAVGGNIAFVGLVVPHAMRVVVGLGHKALIPASVLGGGAFLLACDLAAQLMRPQGEIPLGVITGLVGAPVLLALLRSRRAMHDV